MLKKYNTYTDDTIRYGLSASLEPTCPDEAFSDENWRKANGGGESVSSDAGGGAHMSQHRIRHGQYQQSRWQVPTKQVVGSKDTRLSGT